jgi:hypothetical protein
LRTLVIAIAVVLVALAGAVGVAVTLTDQSAPDKDVKFDGSAQVELWQGVPYGNR